MKPGDPVDHWYEYLYLVPLGILRAIGDWLTGKKWGGGDNG